jgi:hypothetical protein
MPLYDVTVTVRVEAPDAHTALNLVEDAVNRIAETEYLQDSSVEEV